MPRRPSVRTLVCSAILALPLVVVGGGGGAQAGPADVVGAEARQTSEDLWTFSVTVAHADEGWEHYADRWVVLAPDGTVLGERELLHPHVEEQPFTRSLSGVAVPAGVTSVIVRAGDSVHGFGGAEIVLDLPGR